MAAPRRGAAVTVSGAGAGRALSGRALSGRAPSRRGRHAGQARSRSLRKSLASASRSSSPNVWLCRSASTNSYSTLWVLLHPRQVGQDDLAALAGRLDRHRAAAEHPLQQRVRERHVVDPAQRDVPAVPGEHALAQQHPLVGEHVVRRAPLQPRPERQPRQQAPARSPRRRPARPVPPQEHRRGDRPRPPRAPARTTGATSAFQCGCRCRTTSLVARSGCSPGSPRRSG